MVLDPDYSTKADPQNSGVSYYTSRIYGKKKWKFLLGARLPCHITTQVCGQVGRHSIGRRNSNPKRRISPAESWRRTFAVMGGVSLGTRLEKEGEGAGMVKWMI